MSLKVAIVSHIYPTQQVPAQATFIKNEARLLAGNHQVEVYLPSVYSLPFLKQYYRSHNPDEDQIPVHKFSYISIPGRKLPFITRKSLSNNLLKAIHSQDPDLIHLHWIFPSGMAAPKLKSAGYPVIITIHGGDWYTNLGNLTLQPLIKNSLEAADGLICVGKQLYDDISNELPGLKSKLHHIPHGIDTSLFKPPENKSHSKLQLNWNDGHIHLLCVANLYYEKGVDLLIEAFSKILDKDNYHLHIISANGDSRTKYEVEILIREHSLQNQITFYSSQPHDQLVNFYRSADLLVSPSRKEGFGLVVAEAIACGTPVLATKSGGPEEIVTDQTGKIVQPDDVEVLTEGIQEMISALSRFRSENLHNYIETHFSLVSKRKALSELYRNITKSYLGHP